KVKNICSIEILNGNFKLGGRGKTVEIDESMFGNKQKYNRGRVSEGQRVFVMVERDTGRSLVFRVPDRQRETLVTRLIRELHPPDGQPLGKLCRPLHWSTQQHHRRPLESSKTEAEDNE
ncbi:unnamed protein product, partial [Pocillopora meandrina]